MLPRKLRLARRAFSEARSLKRASSPHFSLAYGPAGEFGGGVAVVVSKKVSASAVVRHILKRRTLAIAGAFASPDRILIIHARPNAASLPYAEIESELNPLLRSILPGQVT